MPRVKRLTLISLCLLTLLLACACTSPQPKVVYVPEIVTPAIPLAPLQPRKIPPLPKVVTVRTLLKWAGEVVAHIAVLEAEKKATLMALEGKEVRP